MAGWNEEIKKKLGSCGENVFIGHNVIITQPENVHLGNNVRIDPFTLITCKLVTGDNVQITAYSMLGGSYNTVKLGNWTFIGYGSKLFTGSEDYSGNGGPVNEFWGNNITYKGDIVFNDFCGVASDVIVFPGVELPEGVCIGAKSLVPKATYKRGRTTWPRPGNDLVTSLMMPYNVYVGTPLKHLKSRNKDEIQRLANDPSFQKYPLQGI